MDETQSQNEEKLTKLDEEARRREDIIDDTIEAVTRKTYYAFTLATSVFAIYLASVKDVIVEVDFTQGPTSASATGLAGFAFYLAGALMFWRGHSTHGYHRSPSPSWLVEEYEVEGNDYRLVLGKSRAQGLVANLKIANHIAGIVDAQHDFLLLQVIVLVSSWLLLHLGG